MVQPVQHTTVCESGRGDSFTPLRLTYTIFFQGEHNEDK
jgi:hypothetical protein